MKMKKSSRRRHSFFSIRDSLPRETDEMMAGLMLRVPQPDLLNEKMEHYLSNDEELLSVWKTIHPVYLETYNTPSYFAPIHNDLHQGNVLVDANTHRLSGIIDFEDMVYGHVMREFRHLYSIDPPFMVEVAKAYAQIRELDEKSFPKHICLSHVRRVYKLMESV